jgi:hypothetical protein
LGGIAATGALVVLPAIENLDFVELNEGSFIREEPIETI